MEVLKIQVTYENEIFKMLGVFSLLITAWSVVFKNIIFKMYIKIFHIPKFPAVQYFTSGEYSVSTCPVMYNQVVPYH